MDRRKFIVHKGPVNICVVVLISGIRRSDSTRRVLFYRKDLFVSHHPKLCADKKLSSFNSTPCSLFCFVLARSETAAARDAIKIDIKAQKQIACAFHNSGQCSSKLHKRSFTAFQGRIFKANSHWTEFVPGFNLLDL